MRRRRGTADAEASACRRSRWRAVLGAPARRATARPARGASAHGLRRLELGGERQQRVLAGGLADELHAGGSPSSPLESGSEIAGLAGDVEQRGEGRERPGAREVAHRVRAAASSSPIGSGALGQRGREQRVVVGEERDQPRGRAPAAAASRRR